MNPSSFDSDSEDPRPTLSDLITEHQITMTFAHGAPPSQNFPGSNPWTVTLHRPWITDYMISYYMGPGLVDETKKRRAWTAHEGYTWKIPPAEPDVIHVLNCQLSDADTVEQSQGFEDWCSDLGYSDDSIRARNTYRSCTEAALRLRQFLGSLYETFLYAERE